VVHPFGRGQLLVSPPSMGLLFLSYNLLVLHVRVAVAVVVAVVVAEVVAVYL
jgi:hypothetical protein